MMIRIGESGKAQRMAAMLGEMFRHVLELEGADTITLKRELEFCDLYLSVQQYRFEDRLAVDWDIDTRVLDYPVPTLMLQPVAENAVKFGVSRTTGPCRVAVKAGCEGDRLVVEISNDIPSDFRGTRAGHGIGITNTHARLNEIYGDRASFRLVPDNGCMRAILSVPITEKMS
jgi:LytS/YehU family sensor histidine kinase